LGILEKYEREFSIRYWIYLYLLINS
jgi:hypothetical protein